MLCLCCSFIPTLFLCPGMRSLLWNTCMGCSSSRTVLMWVHLPGLHCSSTGPHRWQLPQTSYSTAVVSTSCSSGLGLLQLQPPWGHIHCCTMGSSMAACGDLLCLMPMGCSGTGCSTMGLSSAVGSFCSGPGAPPAILLCWPWWLQGCFSFPPSSFPAAVAQQISLPSVCSPRGATSIAHWFSCGQWQIHFGVVGAAFDLIWGSSHRGHPYSSSLLNIDTWT